MFLKLNTKYIKLFIYKIDKQTNKRNERKTDRQKETKKPLNL